MRLLRASSGEIVTLAAATTLGTGGEARVLALFRNPGVAAKVYHRPTPERAAKLRAMIANPPNDPMAAQGHVSIAWPSDLLLEPGAPTTVSRETGARQNGVVGFLMPAVRGMSPIIDFYHPKTRRHKHPLFNYLYLLRTARNLAACVSALHARGYVIGDLNESNILVGETALVTLVDTDSFQVPDLAAGRIHRCRVGKPEFTAPELHGIDFAWVDRTPEHDLFALAVLVFQVLMEGVHPFAGMTSGRGEPLPLEERIASGWFPYAPAKGCRSIPMPTSPPFDVLGMPLRELFVRCFVEGHANPTKRPRAEEWHAALQAVETALATCPENDQHRFASHLRSCPWCQRQKHLGGIDPFPSAERVQKRQHLRPVAKGFAPRQRSKIVWQTSDRMEAIEIAKEAIRRQRTARRLMALFAWLVGVALLLFWFWAIKLAAQQ